MSKQVWYLIRKDALHRSIGIARQIFKTVSGKSEIIHFDSISAMNGKLKAPGWTYKVILVPKCTFMPAATLNRLAELAAQGAKMVFEEGLPVDVPVHGGLAKRRELLVSQKRR